MLLERESALACIRESAARVASGGVGELIYVCGEAGIGKTTLLAQACDDLGDALTVWRGSCDNLATPRPLGPLVDIAMQSGGEVAAALRDEAPRPEVFAALLRQLQHQPTVVVIEDAHWADDATIDLLTFLGRRTASISCLLLVSYRDDEIGLQHPLRMAMGGTAKSTRLQLSPLSQDAVAALLGAMDRDVRDAPSLHRLTAGNPFFVTELIAGADLHVSATVRDAVLARASRLGRPARVALDAVAIVPGRTELWLLEGLLAGDEALSVVDECVDRGVLKSDGDAVFFRHELGRIAVLDAIAPARRVELHRRALGALERPPTGTPNISRCAHHAVAGGVGAAVVSYSPRAAALAARVGSHRESASHLAQAVRHAGLLDVDVHLDLLYDLAEERRALAQFTEAEEAANTALGVARAAGLLHREGAFTCLLGLVQTSAGRQLDGEPLVDSAIELLEPLGRSSELAFAYTTRCSHHMLAREFADAEVVGQKAIAMATATGRRDHLRTALIDSGIARFMGGDPAGMERIVRAIALGREDGDDSAVAHGFRQMGSGAGEVRNYAVAIPALQDGAAWSAERELVTNELYAEAWLARCELEQGHVREAQGRCLRVLAHPSCTGVARIVALTVLGRLRARRGDPGVTDVLDEGLALSRASGQLQRLWPIAVARAEAAWLDGVGQDALAVLEEAWDLAVDVGFGWAVGELGDWLARLGHDRRPPCEIPEQFALARDGHHAAAAAAWTALGCPWEAALASLDGSAADVHEAHGTFQELGFNRAVQIAADRLRDLGQRVPRGPNATTLDNPRGLTGRELEVLALLVDGLRNAEIAARLVISAKTAEHHVSSILAKLEVTSRQAAAVHAVRHGWVDDRREMGDSTDVQRGRSS